MAGARKSSPYATGVEMDCVVMEVPANKENISISIGKVCAIHICIILRASYVSIICVCGYQL